MATDIIVPPEQPNASMRCSFCKKTRAQVFKIVLGPNVSICDECVELCEEILAEERLKVKSSAAAPASQLATPREIYSYLNDYIHRSGRGEAHPGGGGVQPLQAHPRY